MKLFKNISYYFLGAGSPVALMWIFPVLLLVPNIVLDFTEVRYTMWQKLVNVTVPLGIYMLLCSWSRNIGRTVLLFIPVMVLCAFQLVLTGLYGESIIAVDMFLNVVTTNMSEATELLAQLTHPILAVCVLYLPPIIAGAMFFCRRQTTTPGSRRSARIAGLCILIIGLVGMGGCFATGRYKAERRMFPVNVVSNMITAAQRSAATAKYFVTSAGYSFDAKATRTPDEKEIYVMVIGETSRADNWQLLGYDRPTNPKLSQRSGLTAFGKTLSESNTTHKSVPLLMSALSADSFGDSIYRAKGVIEAFNEAGFSSAWISNQQRNHSFIDFFGEQAHHVDFLVDDGSHHHDMELIPHLRKFISEAGGNKLFIVLHTYGSHFNYKERFPEEYTYFTPDNSAEAEAENREGLINAYDNTIRYTDAVLDSIISTVAACGCPAAVVYTSDHGEDIFDDSRGRFLHASPNPTYWQIHVPFIVWTSEEYAQAHPEKIEAIRQNSGKNISSSRSVFHTLLSLSGVVAKCYNPGAAVCEKCYCEPPRKYLNDYNEGIALEESGLKKFDLGYLEKKNISTN